MTNAIRTGRPAKYACCGVTRAPATANPLGAGGAAAGAATVPSATTASWALDGIVRSMSAAGSS
jgi:hypothetical protein